MLLMMLLTSISAWADNVTYIDENGDTQYCSNFTILDNSMNDLAEGWYVVNSDVTYNGDLETNGDGDVNIILCDGATLTANNITPKGHKDRLRIYGQSQGTGTANISGSITGNYSLTINGGTINANILDGDQGSVGINGGTVNVTGDIKPYGGVSFNGGNVIVTGEVEAGNYGNIFLSGGTVKASSYSASKGNVYISKGLTYYDGTGASYTGTEELTPGYLNLTSIEIDAIAGKTLRTFDYRGGTCGDPNVNEGKNVTWLLNLNTKTLTISGTGAMANYGGSAVPWEGNKSDITSVLIESGVTTIGNYAFFYCTNLATVTFAAGSQLTSIGIQSFCNTALSTVTIPAGVTSISSNAFSGCEHLASINVEAGSTSFASEGGVLFNYDKTTLVLYPVAKSGTSYEIPSSVESIGDHAFEDCTNLTSITIPDYVTSIGDYAFYHCTGLTSVIIPASVMSIGSWAFSSCLNLSRVYVLRSTTPLTTLGDDAFNDCQNLVIVAAADGNYSGAPNWLTYSPKRGYTVTCADGITATTTNNGPLVEQDETVTLSYTGTATIPAGYCPGYSYNDGSNDHAISGTTFTMPASDITVSASTATADLRSTGTAVEVSYIDEDGTAKTAQAIALDNTMNNLAAGWYVAQGTINYDHQINFNGTAHLILADGCTMTVNNAKKAISMDANKTLTIYGQSGQTGTLNANAKYCITPNSDSSECSVTVNGGIVNANSTDSSHGSGIQVDYVTINGGTVSTSGGRDGIWASYGIAINGGNVSASGTNKGISVGYGNITLGWRNATDRIYASSYSGTVKTNKLFTDAEGNIYGGNVTNLSGLAGKTLQPCAVPYIDEDGNPQTGTDYTLLTSGGATTLPAGTYVVYSDVTFDHTLTLTGDVNLILADGYTMNVGTSDSNRVSGNGINGFKNLTIYGQALGTGALNVYASGQALLQHNITINGGNITANSSADDAIYASNDLIINSGTVNATADETNGIYTTNNITINGGNVNTNGKSYGINAYNGLRNVTVNGGIVNVNNIRANNISLGWTRATDRIYAKSYSINGTVSVATGDDGKKKLYNGYGTFLSGTVSDIDLIKGKTLQPALSTRYIDADGKTANADAIVLTTDQTTLGGGTYVVNSNITYTGTVTIDGDVTLILADGCTMNVGTSESRINGDGIDASNTDNGLTIYGQSAGSGKLNVYVTGDYNYGINVYDAYVQHGGIVNIESSDCCIFAQGDYENSYFVSGSVTVDGGKLTVTSSNNAGIFAAWDIAITGGEVCATSNAEGYYGIFTYGNITLGWTNPTDRIYVSSFYASNQWYGGNVSIKSGQKLTDGTNIYTDATASATLEALEDTALYPYIENLALAANAHDGNYWTTFYCGHTGYKINEGENAWAYTATVSGNELTLHKLGKVIPKQTAVILVGSDNEISMTASTDAAENTVSNDLKGEDVRTSLDDIKTARSVTDGTFYVMGKVNDVFGFFQYTAQYMPARKAYLLISGSNAAPGLKMVFDETTGITPLLSPKGEEGASPWGGLVGVWYDLSGRKLDQHPTQKGLYIVNGKKIVVK